MGRRKMPARPGMVAPDARKLVGLVEDPPVETAMSVKPASVDAKGRALPATMGASALDARVSALEERIAAIEAFLVFP